MFGSGKNNNQQPKVIFKGEGGPIPIPAGFTGITGSGKTDNAHDIIKAVEAEQPRRGMQITQGWADKEKAAIAKKVDEAVFGGKEVNDLINEHGMDTIQSHFARSEDPNLKIAAVRIEAVKRVYRKLNREQKPNSFLELEIEKRRLDGDPDPVGQVLPKLSTEVKLIIMDELPFKSEEK